MPLPPYYLEVIMVGGVASLDTMLMNGRGGLQVFFVSFTKGPGGFPYVFIITALLPTVIPVYGTTLVDHRVFVLGGNQKVFDGSATFEVSLDAISTTDFFDTFTKTLCVGYDNVALTLHSMVGRIGISAPIIDLSGRPVKPFLHLVPKPIWGSCIWWELSWGRVLLNTKGFNTLIIIVNHPPCAITFNYTSFSTSCTINLIS